jgi:4-amino-4-deoxy-L-arabinose transferase-like glycosyltransferase
MTRKTLNSERVLQTAWLLLTVFVFGLVIAIRIRLLEIPLERDEGEYAYAGQLMLQGIPPYKLAYNMKFPGTYIAYALIMSIFGQTITGIHFGFLLVNVATIALIFFLGRRLINLAAGIVAAASYAVLSVSPSVLGLAAHATHFVMLPVLGGTLLLLDQSDGMGRAGLIRPIRQRVSNRLANRRGAIVAGRERRARRMEPTPQGAVTAIYEMSHGRLFASGLLFGTGLLMKQPAVFFILFGAIFLLYHDIRRGFSLKRIGLRILTFSVSAILPFGLACLLLWYAGVFDKFWFWTIDYARQYGSLIPLGKAPHMFAQSVKQVIGPGWMLWALAGFGLIAGFWHKETRTSTNILLGLLAASALALSSGFYFRPHYFVLVLPAVSLLAGVAISRLSDVAASRTTIIRLVPLFILGAAFSLPVFASRKLFFALSPVEASRMIYGLNPFPESIKIAEYIRDRTTPNETIAVLGSEPQIYFYSKRHSATGYVYTYGLMEPQSYARQMQEEMLHEIELARPKYLISVQVPISWLRHPESESLIFTWANQYTRTYYSVVGLVNILSSDQTDYYFGQMPKSAPQLGAYVLICQRKS